MYRGCDPGIAQGPTGEAPIRDGAAPATGGSRPRDE